jgi:PAS domain S-box-containing protein
MKLTNKIILIFTSSIIIAISAMTAMLLPEYFRIVEEASIIEASQQVNTMAQGVGAFFRERKREASTLALSRDVQSMDFQRMRPYLMEFLNENIENIEKIIIGDKKGQFYNTSGGNPHLKMLRTSNDKDPKATPKSIAKRDYWKVTVGSNSFNEKRVYISEPMISYTTGVKQVVVTSSIRRDGAVRGLVGVSITWERVQKLIDKLKYKFLTFQNPRVFLISQSGAYWYHWDPEKVVGLLKKEDKVVKDEIGQTISTVKKIIDEKNQELVFIGNKMIIEESGHALYTANNVDRYIFYRKIPGTTYSIGLDLEKNSVLNALKKFRGDIVPLILLIYFVMLIILSILAKTLITPFKDITEQAKLLLTNEKIDYLEVPKKSDNLVNSLRESINIVIGKFKEKEASLGESEKRLSLAFEASRDGVWDWDIRTNNVKYSPRWFSMLGYEPDELPHVVSTFETLIYEDDKERVSKYLEQYLNGEVTEYSTRIRFRCKNGTIKWVLSRGRIIEKTQDGMPLRMLGTHVDIDEQVKYEHKISELNRSLEKKVAERTSELVQSLKKVSDAKTEAEAANEAKSMFLANMSHEIRTPLNAIIGMTQILISSDIEEAKKKELKTILESGNLLLSLINDVLDLSKIESGKLTLNEEVFTMNDIVDETAKIMAPVIGGKGVEFIIKNDLDQRYEVKGDPERIKQIILNFLSNSSKFTEKGHVQLVISQDNGVFKIMVKDTGVGITKDSRSKIFKPFIQQDSSTTKKFGGTGLGLTICKKFVELMNGHINYISDEGEGSTFWVEIPLEIISQKEYRFEDETYSKLNSKRILIVDKMRENREILKRFFRKLSMDITTVSSTEQLDNKLKDFKFDYVLLDGTLSENPKEFITDLTEKNKETRFVLICSELEKELSDLVANNSNILGFLQRPFLFSNLISLAELFLELDSSAPAVKEEPVFTDYSQYKVLVVDDNMINLKVAKGLLKKFNVDVEIATSGEECLNKLSSQKYDLVFMDVHMPQMSGLDATKKIRSDEKYQNPYIIALTALAMKGDDAKCLEAGMNAYISKPLKFKDLNEALEKFELSRQ